VKKTIVINQVLVVDDDEGLCHLIIKALQKNGYEALGVSSGKDAIVYVTQNPDILILLDQTLPDMTGRDIIETLSIENRKVDFIMMTGQGDERLAVEMMKLGARDYLIKDTGLLDFLPGVIKRVMQTIETENRLIETEKALGEIRNLLDTTQHLAKIGGWEWDVISQTILWTNETYRLHGIHPGEIEPGSIVHIERSLLCYETGYRELVQKAFTKCIQDGTTYCLEGKFTSENGHELWVQTSGEPVFKESKIIKVIGNIADITERKVSELAQDKLREQLNQAQKMDSIGRLAGGVAHDFNNMLSAIISSAQLALIKGGNEAPFKEYLNNIIKAGSRSADLTRQLLSFARKQTIAPKYININECISAISKMLIRLIGENISLIFQPDTTIGVVKMDPGQIDQIVTNLCVNSRDSIKSNGTITIITENAFFDKEYCINNPGYSPGQFVMIEVRDTGCGMSAEIRNHLFEPFFTTKEIGKGTGLGLATVYGMVQQNNGFIIVESELDMGTSFKIYLSKYDGEIEDNGMLDTNLKMAIENKVILVVEDEEIILTITAEMLEMFGYTILKSSTPEKALQIAEKYNGKIDLLITDIIMPHCNGRDLANKLLDLYPHMRCLFMSGYTADIIGKSGILDSEIDFIQKPFSIDILSKKIKEIFDR